MLVVSGLVKGVVMEALMMMNDEYDYHERSLTARVHLHCCNTIHQSALPAVPIQRYQIPLLSLQQRVIESLHRQ
jgi:hypothetical protein